MDHLQQFCTENSIKIAQNSAANNYRYYLQVQSEELSSEIGLESPHAMSNVTNVLSQGSTWPLIRRRTFLRPAHLPPFHRRASQALTSLRGRGSSAQQGSPYHDESADKLRSYGPLSLRYESADSFLAKKRVCRRVSLGTTNLQTRFR